MTVDEHVMNRYSLSNYVSTPFHKLFDANHSYFHNPSDLVLQPKRHPFQFSSFPPGILNGERIFGGAPMWKTGGPLSYFPLQQYPPMKYFAPPGTSLDMLNNYLPGPSADMIKYVEKIREEELSVKIKDNPGAKLCEDDLWKRFNGLTTEMVITKSGRRMFPAFKVQLSGLDPKSKYVLALEMMPCDDNRFKFHNGKWTLAGKADPESNKLFYLHCESPATGDSWMQKAVWFNKVKLTNNPTDKDPQHLVLNSMHKYVMRLHVFRVDDTNKVRFCLYPEVFVFRTTEFIAVTAYQNDKITQLKIDNNPFAKGFRDNGSGRREKKRLKYQQTINSTSQDSPTELDFEVGIKDGEVQKPMPESPIIKSTFFATEGAKEKFPETSRSSPASTCSSQEEDGPKPLGSPSQLDSQPLKSSDLKRRYSCVSPDHMAVTKRRGFSNNADRRSSAVKYHPEEPNHCLRGPHTVHYTPRRLFTPTLGFLDNVSHSLERPVCPLKPSWNPWPGSNVDPFCSLQMVSKLSRIMSQYKGNQVSNFSGETLMKSFNTMWSRNNQQYCGEDSAEKPIGSSLTGFDIPSQSSNFGGEYKRNEEPPSKIDKKTSSSTFNVISLL